MKKLYSLFILIFTAIAFLPSGLAAQQKLDSILPVRAFCIGAPRPTGVDSFVHFIDAELAPRQVNTLILRVDYHYQFKSHPELIDSFALSKADVREIVKICKKDHIRIIPEIDLLGHQSDRNKPGKLLSAYPQFDETPWVRIPAVYTWPNADDLYCKSYCPLSPGVHKILFDVIDELCDVFHADAFHAGMDEVFYLGESQCPRCKGKDPAELFAGEVRTIHDHLTEEGREMWMWGDRLLDGRTTGVGMWEGSYNNTYRAIDMIPKDIVICDWHYDRPDKTPVYFAMKGFRVVICPWRKPGVAVDEVNDLVSFRAGSTPEMKERFLGVAETIWSRTDIFLQGYYGILKDTLHMRGENTGWNCFRTMYDRIGKLQDETTLTAGNR